MSEQTEDDYVFVGHGTWPYQHIPAKFLLTAARQTQKENEE